MRSNLLILIKSLFYELSISATRANITPSISFFFFLIFLERTYVICKRLKIVRIFFIQDSRQSILLAKDQQPSSSCTKSTQIAILIQNRSYLVMWTGAKKILVMNSLLFSETENLELSEQKKRIEVYHGDPRSENGRDWRSILNYK